MQDKTDHEVAVDNAAQMPGEEDAPGVSVGAASDRQNQTSGTESQERPGEPESWPDWEGLKAALVGLSKAVRKWHRFGWEDFVDEAGRREFGVSALESYIGCFLPVFGMRMSPGLISATEREHIFLVAAEELERLIETVQCRPDPNLIGALRRLPPSLLKATDRRSLLREHIDDDMRFDGDDQRWVDLFTLLYFSAARRLVRKRQW